MRIIQLGRTKSILNSFVVLVDKGILCHKYYVEINYNKNTLLLHIHGAHLSMFKWTSNYWFICCTSVYIPICRSDLSIHPSNKYLLSTFSVQGPVLK